MAELWDAYDQYVKHLGFDLVRGETVPAGVYHLVVKVVTVAQTGEVLLTQRSPEKKNALAWEFTGGCVKKGETARYAAARELREETGIAVAEEELEPLTMLTVSRERGSYHMFIYAAMIPAPCAVTLLEGETVDSRWVTCETFREMVQTDPKIVPAIERQPFLDALDRFLKNKGFC